MLKVQLKIYKVSGEGADNWAKVNLNYEKNDGTEYNKHDESFGFDVTHDESGSRAGDLSSHAPLTVDESISPSHIIMQESIINNFTPDNIDISRPPTSVGRLKWKTFLVSFMVDARGGAMRGCRHSGVRIIIPPRKAPMPMRITCRYLKKEKLIHPPPLMEGEACASRILEVGPSGAKFLGPVIIEVPHFASMRGREREIIILRSDDGENWKEHTLEASEEAVRDILNESFQGDSDLNALEPEFSSDRITRILTTDFPQYFAIITRIRQEVNAMGPEGGMVNSSVVPQVQAIFPAGALTKKIKVGLQVGKNKNGNESEDDNEDETKGRKRKSRLSSFGLGLKKRLGRGNKKAKPSASTTKDLTISSPITVLSTSNQLEESTKMELSEDENIVQTSSKSITTTTIAPSEPQIETKISSNHVSIPEPLVVTSDGANVSEPRCSTSISVKSASSSDCKKKDKSRLRTNRTELSHASNCFAEFVRVTMPNLDLFARMI